MAKAAPPPSPFPLIRVGSHLSIRTWKRKMSLSIAFLWKPLFHAEYNRNCEEPFVREVAFSFAFALRERALDTSFFWAWLGEIVISMDNLSLTRSMSNQNHKWISLFSPFPLIRVGSHLSIANMKTKNVFVDSFSLEFTFFMLNRTEIVKKPLVRELSFSFAFDPRERAIDTSFFWA